MILPDPDIPPEDLSRFLTDNRFDHIDFGCSSGGSLKLAREAYGGVRGIGIDVDERKVLAARRDGLCAIKYDIASLPDQPLVRFTIMSHFLEHVESQRDVAAYIGKACRVSTQFVIIQQPYFDADGRLAEHGLKLFWSDWHGHPNRMSSLAMYCVLRDLLDGDYRFNFSIHARGQIGTSADPRVHPIDTPRDQHEYDPGVHAPKNPNIVFESPVFAELVCLITMPSVNHEALVSLLDADTLIAAG